MQKTRFSQKLNNLELWCLLTTYRKLCIWAFQRTHYWIPKIQDGWNRPSWKSTWRHFFSAEGGGPIWINFGDWCRMTRRLRWCGRNRKPDVEFQYGGRLGEFNGMSSQSHVSYCSVLPLGEFTVMIPEPHATLQGAVTWRNQCRDRATLQGVIIPSAISFFVSLIVFRHILFFCFLMQFGLWWAVGFVSSPIHLLLLLCMVCVSVCGLRDLSTTTLLNWIHLCWILASSYFG